MKVHELISKLSTMPQDADVEYLEDSVSGNSPDMIWESKDGRVLIAEDGSYINRSDYPKHADTPEIWPRLSNEIIDKLNEIITL
jgi:hypothetical protein